MDLSKIVNVRLYMYHQSAREYEFENNTFTLRLTPADLETIIHISEQRDIAELPLRTIRIAKKKVTQSQHISSRQFYINELLVQSTGD